jgi:hypothetical protein
VNLRERLNGENMKTEITRDRLTYISLLDGYEFDGDTKEYDRIEIEIKPDGITKLEKYLARFGDKDKWLPEQWERICNPLDDDYGEYISALVFLDNDTGALKSMEMTRYSCENGGMHNWSVDDVMNDEEKNIVYQFAVEVSQENRDEIKEKRIRKEKEKELAERQIGEILLKRISNTCFSYKSGRFVFFMKRNSCGQYNRGIEWNLSAIIEGGEYIIARFAIRDDGDDMYKLKRYEGNMIWENEDEILRKASRIIERFLNS